MNDEKPAMGMSQTSFAATTLVIDDAGIAIRGASGSGKSALAIALIERVRNRHFARLVSDDVTRIEKSGDRIIARTAPHIAGYIERRGFGIVPMSSVGSVVLRLVVDCLGEVPLRLPEPAMLVTDVLGVTLPRIAVEGRISDVSLVLNALELMHSGRSY